MGMILTKRLRKLSRRVLFKGSWLFPNFNEGELLCITGSLDNVIKSKIQYGQKFGGVLCVPFLS